VQAVFARVDTRAQPTQPELRARPSRFTPSFPMLFVIAIILFFVVKEIATPQSRASRNAYTAGRRGWYAPTVMFPWFGSGRGGGGWGGGGGGGGGGFSGGGGSFGGGGASGSW
jgi:uncharacterized protein